MHISKGCTLGRVSYDLPIAFENILFILVCLATFSAFIIEKKLSKRLWSRICLGICLGSQEFY